MHKVLVNTEVLILPYLAWFHFFIMADTLLSSLFQAYRIKPEKQQSY